MVRSRNLNSAWPPRGNRAVSRHTEVVGKDDESNDWLPLRSLDPVPPEHVERLKRLFPAALFQHGQRIAAEAALEAVLDDAERVRGVRPLLEVVFSRNWFRVAYALERHTIERTAERLDAVNLTGVFVEVADAVFDLLADEDMAVPFECPQHSFGLHPRMVGGAAVWWCQPPGHVVAAIGHLGEGGSDPAPLP